MFTEESLTMLEYPEILRRLEALCLTPHAQTRARTLRPMEDPDEIAQTTARTQSARRIFEAMGAPPVSGMEGLAGLFDKLRLGEVLSGSELSQVSDFLNHCRLLVRYLERARSVDPLVASYGQSIDPLTGVREELERCLRGGQVDDHASPQLRSLRAQREQLSQKLRDRLTGMLRAHPAWFQESYYSQRGNRYVLPVKRECRAQVPGTVVDASASGITLFIEPAAARQLTDQLDQMAIEEENEVFRILAELSALVAGSQQPLKTDCQAMEEIDYAFACGRLGSEMNGVAAQPTRRRELALDEARHPLLSGEVVPLTLALGQVRALVITGPNTGGKTVAIKTVGLLTLMALSGLLVPARSAVIPAFYGVYSDIGDGQNLSQNLSTFSSHVGRVVRILQMAGPRSLVLLDELGSGTDPQEGMGLAVAVLEELGRLGCLLVATSHYPEIKRFAASTPGFQNARMTFDRASLRPMYQLEMGEAGESCALYIAKRLGVPEQLLSRAWQVAYPDGRPEALDGPEPEEEPIAPPAQTPAEAPPVPEDMPLPAGTRQKAKPERFHLGDRVQIPFMRRQGTVAQLPNARGEMGVLIQGKVFTVPERRVQPFLSGEALYPDAQNYDLDIVLDTVENRKAKVAVRKGKRGASFEVRPERTPR